MPAKKRCQKSECRKAAIRIAGECPHCNTHFCSDHRLPESHECTKLADCKRQAFDLNRAKLESEIAIAPKLVS